MVRSIRVRRSRAGAALVTCLRVAPALGSAAAALLGLLVAAVAVTTAGASSTRTLVTRAFAAAAPSAATARVLETRGPVVALAADGGRVTLAVRSLATDHSVCVGVIAWEPMRSRVVRLERPCPYDAPSTVEGVALAGTRVAWVTAAGGMSTETIVKAATLARPRPVWLGYGVSAGGEYGTFAKRPFGDGALLAFTLDERCADYEGSDVPCPPGRRTGDVIAAAVWRMAGRGRCPNNSSPVRRCSRVVQAEGELTVLAVDAGRIAVRTDDGVRLLSASGNVLQRFDVTSARQAALSGKRFAVRTVDAVEIYDVGSGELVSRFASARHLRLEDLDGGILVTALGRTVALRRLGNGRTATIRAGGTARAQLERPGLFVAAGRSVKFTPTREVLRMLSDRS
jgi:hypothetical protein